MVEIAATRDIPPSRAIRASLARLDAMLPTWGTLPDTRDGLARALALPPSSRALLMKGDLADATRLCARLHSQRGDSALTQSHWWNTRLGCAIFAMAIIAVVAG